jgi:6,7-dimethyl-8-ribityllumazine synthase
MDERVTIYEGALDARGLSIGIVASRFNDFIIDRLLEAAVDTLLRHGAEAVDIEVARVPGAFELPLAVKKMAAAGRHDALIALGCVIRGATPHFDFVAGEASRGIARASYEHGIPISFGVLTVDTVEQAMERAGTKSGNKGVEAALAAVQMASVLRQIERQRGE